jgi:ribose transport system ATP-binding protein
MLFGDLPRSGGDIVLDGMPVYFRTPKDALNAGVALVPEDRGGDAVFSEMSVLVNLSASVVRSYWNAGRFRNRRERSDGGAVVDAFRVRTQTLDQPLSTLSGGNQQKVVLARWLRRSPRLLLLDEPTQGVDVGARADIYEFIRGAVTNGTSAVVVASDFEELARSTDRVLVLRGGMVMGELRRPDIDPARIAELTYTIGPTTHA